MAALRGVLRLGIEKGRLDKQMVGTRAERANARDIARRVARIHHISDALTFRRAERALLQHAQGDARRAGDHDKKIVRRTAPNRAFRLVEPWAAGQA